MDQGRVGADRRMDGVFDPDTANAAVERRMEVPVPRRGTGERTSLQEEGKLSARAEGDSA